MSENGAVAVGFKIFDFGSFCDTRRSSGAGVAPRACVRVYARVLVPPNLYIHTYMFLCGKWK